MQIFCKFSTRTWIFLLQPFPRNMRSTSLIFTQQTIVGYLCEFLPQQIWRGAYFGAYFLLQDEREWERERERESTNKESPVIISFISYFPTHTHTFSLSHTLLHTLSGTLSLVFSHKPSPADVCPSTLARLLIKRVVLISKWFYYLIVMSYIIEK